jgi:F0F1-type ATP synthase delta subunit
MIQGQLSENDLKNLNNKSKDSKLNNLINSNTLPQQDQKNLVAKVVKNTE